MDDDQGHVVLLPIAGAPLAMEAMGARFEGIHRHHMLVRGGENRDSAWYSVTDDDWPGVRDGLAARLARM